MTRRAVIVGLALLMPCSVTWGGNVTLPDKDTDDGLLARLMIAECRTPAHAQYDADNVKKGMRAMKATVDNRLKNKPGQFVAPGATKFVDIVGAPNQFQGFSKNAAGKIVIGATQQGRIDEVVMKANMGKPGKYAEFVNNALAVARGPVDDPFKDVKKVGNVDTRGGTFGWNTVGAPALGGNFVAIPAAQGGIISGNQFYTLKK